MHDGASQERSPESQDTASEPRRLALRSRSVIFFESGRRTLSLRSRNVVISHDHRPRRSSSAARTRPLLGRFHRARQQSSPPVFRSELSLSVEALSILVRLVTLIDRGQQIHASLRSSAQEAAERSSHHAAPAA